MLGAAAGGGPVREGFKAVAVFPTELEKFASVKISGFLAEEGFEAPLDVRALPRAKTVAAGSEPIKLEHVPQATQVYGISFPLVVVSRQFPVKKTLQCSQTGSGRKWECEERIQEADTTAN
jgi:hypothetical protein